MSKPISLYGATWPAGASAFAIELACIRKGGKWINNGKECGNGKSFHFERARKLLWPRLDDHRWNTLCRDVILNSKISVLMGPGSSGKTHTAAWVRLIQYYAFPDNTCVLVSSTDMRGLELRVWGEIKMLHEAAINGQYGLEVPGYLTDSKHAISTDELDEDSVRDLRKGIIGIPCVQNGKFVGLGKYSGIKQDNVYLIADEAQFMGASFLSAFANLNNNSNFEATVLGNPNDILDPLGKAAEPIDGWENHLEPKKTDCWDTRFMNGRCVNLVGTDSPNFDFPEDEPTRYKYLISREKIASTVSFFAKDSIEYFSQCLGVMKIGTISKRVISRSLCRQFHAFDEVIWRGTPLVKIFALDAAYGGDRCVGGHIEFGLNVEGKMILNINPPKIVPILVSDNEVVEDQIARWIMKYCDNNVIPPENAFHDSTGRGALGTSLARIWSAMTNPVEFGGKPTDRPVSLDMYVFDPITKSRRLKLCSEHYVKFVTELWFSVAYAIEAGQVRGLTEELLEEGCMRMFEMVNGDKRELETKEKMKLRVGRSPDLFDWLAIAVEGARRRGFNIPKLANEQSITDSTKWFWDRQRKLNELRKQHALDHSV